MQYHRYLILLGVVISTVFHSTQTWAQAQLKFTHIRPTGNMGRLLEPKNTVEFGFSGNFIADTRRYTASLLICNFEPRLDRFPIYIIQNDGAGNSFQGGFETYDKYRMVAVSFGADYQLFSNKKYSLYMGADVVVGAMHINYQQEYGNVAVNSFQLRSAIGGFRGRLGAEYYLSDSFDAFIDIARTGLLISDPQGVLAFNAYSIGLRYNF